MRFSALLISLCVACSLLSAELAQAAPTITAISPNNGTVDGGTPVTITGTEFITGTTVKFGTKAATGVVINSSTSITATSPASTGTVDIAVVNSKGSSTATAADQYAYDPVPAGSWLGLNGNDLTFLGPVGFFAEHNASYDRVELTAGELPKAGDTLERAINAGMTPVMPIEYAGYEGNWGTPDPNFPTEANGKLTTYVKGFIETAAAVLSKYPGSQVLFEPMNEPWGYTTPIYNGAEYANAIAKLLPEAQSAGIPASDIYVAAFGNDCPSTNCGGTSCEPGCVGNGWVPAMYEAQPSLKKEIQGWYFHPYGHPSGSEFGDSRGVESLPRVQTKMTSGQNNIIISEMGFCVHEVNLGHSCGELGDDIRTTETGAEAAQDLTEALYNAQPYYQAGWLRGLLNYSRNDGGWAMQSIPNGGFLTATGSAFTSYADSEKVPTASSHFGSSGGGNGQFETAFGDAVDPTTGNVYVTNFTKSRVEEFESNGTFLANVGAAGSGNGQFTAPEAIATDNSGNVYVADSGNGRIVEFNSAGAYQTKFGAKGTGNGQFGATIAGMTVDSSGNLWVSDSNNERVEKFNSAGEYQTKFGSEGSGNGQFFGPAGIALSGGHLYVTDFFNHRVQEFSTAGAYLSQFGTLGNGNGQLEAPASIASDARTGNLFVADHNSDTVEEFGPNGDFIAYLGKFGSGNGQFNDPKAVATSAGGGLYVVDEGNHRVDIWNSPSAAWESQTLVNPTGATASQLQSVSCAEGCTAVGSFTNSGGTKATLAELWNGTEWTKQTTPNPSGALASSLAGVTCSSTKACTAVGAFTNSSKAEVTLALTWNGSSWSVQSTPNPGGAGASSLAGVACPIVTSCTAVGSSANGSGTKAALAESLSGTTWTKQTTPSPSGALASSLTGVSCSSTKACTAVGSYVNSSKTEMTLAMAWNGSTWSVQSTPNPGGAGASGFAGVSCPSSASCTAVGSSTNAAGTKAPLAESWNGTSWTRQNTPIPNGAGASALSSVSCITTSACSAVGISTNGAGSKATLAEGWNGTLWSLQGTPSPTGGKVNGFAGISCMWITGCYAVGSYTDAKSTLLTLAQKYFG